MSTEKIEITVVGAGVVGCAVALELARSGRQVLVLEKNPGISRGENQSSRNSGVIHAGLYYDQDTQPLKAELCAKGNALLYEFCEQYEVPALRAGKLVVAANDSQADTLHLYQERARLNGVPVEWLDAGRVAEIEPKLKAEAALHLPSSGLVDAAALVHKLYALGSNQGVQFMAETTLDALDPHTEGLETGILYRDGARDRFLSGQIINCAGLYSDEVARMADSASPYQIDPVRGEAMKFYRHKRPELDLAGMNIYPTPRQVTTKLGTYFTVGVHLTPTLEIGPQGEVSLGPVITVGPLNRPARHKEDYGDDLNETAELFRSVSEYFPYLREEDLEPHQVGILARLANSQDWVIEFSSREPRCLNLLGIDSPGLTGSLAIAQRVSGMLSG